MWDHKTHSSQHIYRGARAKIALLKSTKQSFWSSTDEPYHLSHYIFSWSPYLQLQNAKLNLSNFIVTSSFNREVIIHALVGILHWNKQKSRKNSKTKYKSQKTKLLLVL